MGDHHALRIGGGARGVLDEGEALGAEVGTRPGPPGLRGHPVGGEERDAGERRLAGGELPEPWQEARLREDRARPGVREDRRKARDGPRPAGRIGGHRHHARRQAAEEGGDELQARGVEEDGGLAGPEALAQGPGDSPRPRLELAPAQPFGGLLAVAQPAVEVRLGELFGPFAQNLDERARPHTAVISRRAGAALTVAGPSMRSSTYSGGRWIRSGSPSSTSRPSAPRATSRNPQNL